MIDLDELAREYVEALRVRPAPELTGRVVALRRRRRVRRLVVGCAAALVLVAGGALAIRMVDGAETVRAVDVDSSPTSAEPPEAWQLDLSALPDGWSAELTDVTATAGGSFEEITVRYELREEDRTATLMLIPGEFELVEASLIKLRRNGRVIDAQSTEGGSALAWNEPVAVGVFLQGEIDPEDLLDLAEGLPIVRDEAIGAPRPDESLSIPRSAALVEGSVDGIPWRLLVGGGGLAVGLEIDGLVTESSQWDDGSLSSLRGGARATVFSVDGARFVLVSSTEADDRVGLSHQDGTRTRFASAVIESGRLVLTPIAIPADVDASAVVVWNERIGRELMIELPALPSTGWARGEGSNYVLAFPRD